MADILSTLGEDLAFAVKQKNLPTVELDIDKPKLASYRLFPMLLGRLHSAMNSIFLVGNDLTYLNAYINALALLMGEPNQFAEVIRKYKDQLEDEYVTDRVERVVQRLVGKRLHTLDVHKLLSFSGSGKAVWDEVFGGLIEETREKGYFLVIDQIHELYRRDRESGIDNHASTYLYFATRGRVRLTFIAPMTWPNYVRHIEGPPMTLHRTPFFFSPRPSDLPYAPLSGLGEPPDHIFVFSD